jgi:anaerobic magnesium-protoporphyrin IX monomethyl ester cyclase
MACKFCEDARTLTRWTSLDNAEAELADIVSLGYGGVYLFDDLFAINLGKCQPYLNLLKQSGLKFRCNVHARFMTDEFAAALAEAGCVEAAFGAESGSQVILDRIDKKTTVQQNFECVQYCKNHGITVKAFLMIGLPGETRETVAETERFILESGIDDAQLAIYYPYKGTMLRREMDEGLTSDLVVEGEGLGAYAQKDIGTDAVVRTPELSADELIEIREDLILTYKFRSHVGPRDHFFDTHLNAG